jgi:hypothetical protein
LGLSRWRAQLRLDDVEGNASIARPDEDCLGAELTKRRVQRTPTGAEVAVSRYGSDFDFAMPSPASRVDEGCDALRV